MAKEREQARIAIIGLGLIGGSLALALKAARPEGISIIGYDKDGGVLAKARGLGAIDVSAPDLPRAVAEASLVIIATPILALRQVLADIAPALPQNCVVTDTASTKALVLQWAQELLPSTVSFVGGHPLAGKETQGINNADAHLFADKAYCVIPSVSASEGAVRVVLGLVNLVGARPLFIDAQEHDQYVAAVSHLPLILSTALFTLVRGSPGWSDLAPLAASAFRDLTRLASGEPEMSHDICLTNREALLHWLERMQGELSRYRQLLEGDSQELFAVFARAQLDRDSFLKGGQRLPETAMEVPRLGEQLATLLLGERLLRRARDIGRVLKEGSAEAGPRKKGPSWTEKMAEDIKRDLEKRSRPSGHGRGER